MVRTKEKIEFLASRIKALEEKLNCFDPGVTRERIKDLEKDFAWVRCKFRCAEEGHTDKSVFKGNDGKWHFYCDDCQGIIGEVVLKEKTKKAKG